MIVKVYYQDGRTDAFDTANLTDVSTYRENVVTNWSLDLSGAMSEGGMLLLSPCAGTPHRGRTHPPGRRASP